ncbi:hypothetical protein [Bradyrhizobium sp. Ai1a-2]|uniref:hypothetical protein n=1 Tax=Bradyrhizobium sp. Ai1a-2 TaxID=196490 RepID=UPI00048820BD|nr:hypothetical protein [Bradyrhizobium sp. Ai1a-2]
MARKGLTTVADDILREVRGKPGLTAGAIVLLLFGDEAALRRNSPVCRRLVDNGRLIRRGKGGPSDAFTYHLPTHPSILPPT